jgi:hypothetical protein
MPTPSSTVSSTTPIVSTWPATAYAGHNHDQPQRIDHRPDIRQKPTVSRTPWRATSCRNTERYHPGIAGDIIGSAYSGREGKVDRRVLPAGAIPPRKAAPKIPKLSNNWQLGGELARPCTVWEAIISKGASLPGYNFALLLRWLERLLRALIQPLLTAPPRVQIAPKNGSSFFTDRSLSRCRGCLRVSRSLKFNKLMRY